ncbi:alpha/beta hydrolase [Ktedonospora formicarum]|uniref:Carboxylesterase n=1 Tax=Ktedonospora formicarum TaxID=2778364 RepID=A0A8J3MNF3_9CHLR|nr:alpha/beta fold hydrolase [Ktedonospora formicarum]GHO42672.1 carboxylesterase [Ktedonospora formicarum]
MVLRRNAGSFQLGPEQTDRACVLIHNIGGSPLEMYELGEYLAEQNIRVHGILLAGHDGDVDTLSICEREEWLETIAQEIEVLKDHPYIFLAGFSLGAVMALLTALEYADRITGVIAMSTPLRLASGKHGLSNYFSKWFTPLDYLEFDDPNVRRDVIDCVRIFDPKSMNGLSEEEILGLARQTARFPLATWRQMTALARDLRGGLRNLVTPLLIIHGRHDAIAHPENALELYQKAIYAPKSLHWLERSGHVLMEGPESEQLHFLCASFINDTVLHDLMSG